MTTSTGQPDAAREPAPPRSDDAPPEVSESMRAAMDEALRSAVAGPARAPSPHPIPAPGAPTIKGPRVVEAGREHRRGQVVAVGPDDVILEFGPKELGIVRRNQWTGDDPLPAVGEEIEVVIDRYEATESIYICSRPGAVRKADWEFIEPGQVIEARVTGVNKGGLELEVAGHSAFMPAGQVSLDHVPDLSVFVGEKLTCKVQRVDRYGRGNIVLTRRELLADERRRHADDLKKTIEVGQVLEGTVRKIMPFGAFVDLGGVDGLVHLTDLTHERVNHGERNVARYVKEGQKVRVQVLKVDWEAGRLSLGLKQTQEDPFAKAAGQIGEGDEVTGRVTRCAEFGAFVEIGPGVEGLIHISELAHRRVARVEDVLRPDQVVKVKVVKLDRESRRIGLSMKALEPRPEEPRSKGRGDRHRGPSYEEIMKETPALRRLREKFGKGQFKGGLG